MSDDFQPVEIQKPRHGGNPVLRRVLTYLVGVGLGIAVLVLMKALSGGP